MPEVPEGSPVGRGELTKTLTRGLGRLTSGDTEREVRFSGEERSDKLRELAWSDSDSQRRSCVYASAERNISVPTEVVRKISLSLTTNTSHSADLRPPPS